MRGTTNAIDKPKKVLANFTMRFYQKSSSSNWYYCMDTSQLSALEDFLSDLEDCIAVYSTTSITSPITNIKPGWAMELVASDDTGYGTDLTFDNWRSTFSASSITYKWNTSSSSAPTQAKNTYSRDTGVKDSSWTTSGKVTYWALLKIVL